jgi:hypothetical protein
MRARIIILLALCAVIGCQTLPTGKVTKVAGKKYEERQLRLGPFPLWKVVLEVKSPLQETRSTIRKPAEWCLWIATPVALVAFALTVAVHAPPLQKKLFGVAVVAGLVCVGATAILIATTSMWVLVLGIVGLGAWVCYHHRDSGLLFKKGAAQ